MQPLSQGAAIQSLANRQVDVGELIVREQWMQPNVERDDPSARCGILRCPCDQTSYVVKASVLQLKSACTKPCDAPVQDRSIPAAVALAQAFEQFIGRNATIATEPLLARNIHSLIPYGKVILIKTFTGVSDLYSLQRRKALSFDKWSLTPTKRTKQS